MNEVFTAASNISLSLIMNFVLNPPSLEHRCFVKIVVTLWNQKDVRALIPKRSFESSFNPKNPEWNTIEERVMQKVPQLSLPQVLDEVVLGFIKPTGSQIYEWMHFHCTEFCLRVGLPAEFIWTAHGTIDRKRTAEVLVKDEKLDLSTRYKLACIYCLEDTVIQFWNNMPRVLKESDWDKFRIIRFWSRTMKRRGLANEHTSYKDELKWCIVGLSKAASEYFLRKLTPIERRESLVETAQYVEDADVLCFLLSQMDEEQQMKVFKHRPRTVLIAFLQLPWQRFFIGVANCVWDFLAKSDFECILLHIVQKVKDGNKDWNYRKLFGEFWQESPNALKSLITNDGGDSWLLFCLFLNRDKESIRVILNDATLAAKKKLSYGVCGFCENYILNNEWDFLEFCIRECLPSKDEMLKFKELFEKREKQKLLEYAFVENKHKWEQLFHFSDDSVCRYEKRSAEEGESSSSKRFRNLQ